MEASQEGVGAAAAAATRGQYIRTAGVLMFGLILIAYVLMAADRFLFPVLAADIRKSFGFSLQNTGLLTTIFTVGLGITGLPTGYLLARYSRKAVLSIGIVIFSAATMGITVAQGFSSMLVCLAVQGIGMSMLATTTFALAASYFSSSRATAVGAVNVCYGLGGIIGPIFAGQLRTSYGTWHAPMLAFGAAGLAMVVLIVPLVRPWFSETQHAAQAAVDQGGADSLNNRNTVILTALSVIMGLCIYGFLGLYPTFLRETQHYTPAAAGTVMSFYGIGSLTAILAGWLGDRVSAKALLTIGMLGVVVLGLLFFLPGLSTTAREALTFIYGIIGAGLLYTNLAACHIKALRRSLAGRGSGMFVTSLYGGAALGGYALGAIATNLGWIAAGRIQISLLGLIGAVLVQGLRRDRMSS